MDGDSKRSTVYELDFHAWANEQAGLLRAGRLSDIDASHIAEEIEASARSERRELINRLSVLLLHLLKWSYQPDLRGRSWELTIKEQRRQLDRHLNKNPSLKPWIDEAMADAYGDAVLRAELEMNLLRDMLPWSCPYRFEQVMDEAFWPDLADRQAAPGTLAG